MAGGLSQPSVSVTSANPSMPSLITLHPTLRDHWANFEGDLNTQLANGQRDEYYTDADTHMEGFRALDVISQRHQVQQTEERRVYPLTIPTSPHTDTSSAASTYGPDQGGIQYPSTSPQAPSHHHQQTHSYHYYQPDVLQSASSQSPQEYSYHATDPRYEPYPQPTYQYQHQHQPGDRGQQCYETQPQHHPADTTSRQYTPATAQSQYTLLTPDYQDPCGRLRHWDDASRTRADPRVHSVPLGSYSQYEHHYAYARAGESIAEEPLQQQQLHLQETWRSFGVYVGSPRPTP